MAIEKSRQFCRDYFVVYFDVNILFLFLILDFCFYLIFHKSSKYKDFKEKLILQYSLKSAGSGT